MGWVAKAPSGHWKASYRDPSKRIRSKTFARKSDAERWLRHTEVSIDRGAYVDPAKSRQTLNRYVDRYFATAAHLRPKTIDTYRYLTTRHVLPVFGRYPIGQIASNDVKAFIATSIARGVSPATTAAAFRVLRVILSAAERDGLIVRNPARGVELPAQPKRDMRFLDADEVDRAANAVPDRYRALVLTLAYTGIRIGEAIAVRVDRLDLLRGRLQIVGAASEVKGQLVFGPTKTGKDRVVSLPSFLREELAAHLAVFPPVNKLVFTNSDGAPIRQSNFNRKVWHPAVARASIAPPLPRVHDLRHTSVALAIASDAHPKEIQERLGHSSITVTLDRYGHLFPGLDERLAERLDAVGRAAQSR